MLQIHSHNSRKTLNCSSVQTVETLHGWQRRHFTLLYLVSPPWGEKLGPDISHAGRFCFVNSVWQTFGIWIIHEWAIIRYVTFSLYFTDRQVSAVGCLRPHNLSSVLMQSSDTEGVEPQAAGDVTLNQDIHWKHVLSANDDVMTPFTV